MSTSVARGAVIRTLEPPAPEPFAIARVDLLVPARALALLRRVLVELVGLVPWLAEEPGPGFGVWLGALPIWLHPAPEAHGAREGFPPLTLTATDLDGLRSRLARAGVAARLSAAPGEGRRLLVGDGIDTRLVVLEREPVPEDVVEVWP